MSAILWSLFLTALGQATPLTLAALGGIFSERAGVINIGLEGMMLTAAFAGVWAGQQYGPLTALSIAVGAAGGVALLHYLLTQWLGVNHIISGVAINIGSASGTTFLLRRMFHEAEPPREAKVAHLLPAGLFLVAAALLPMAVHFVLQRTRFGLRLRAVGESPLSARIAGVRPGRLRFAGVLLSGLFAGLAGAFLSMAQSGRFSDNMTQGRGYIALAAVICGRWRPIGAASAALVFGLFDALQIRLQGSVRMPVEILQSLPYVVTILAALALRTDPPAALGVDEQ